MYGTSIKLVLLHAVSPIYFFGFACAFAIKPHPNFNKIDPATTMAPNPDRTIISNFGTFDRQPLIHQGYTNQRVHPLAMIPERRNQFEQNRNNTQSTRPLTFLDATKRTREASIETQELLPELPKQETGLAQITQPITNTITSLANSVATSKKLQGRAILLLVAFLYGTLNVTLRGVYATEGPPVASVLSLVRQLLSVIAFIPLLALSKDEKSAKDIEVGKSNTSDEVEKVRPMWMAALELAFWNFGAQGLINAGLLFSPAARAAFLTQTSVVMTPLISRFAGESIKNTVWGGCALALAGLFLISTAAADGADISNTVEDAGMSMSFSQGDVMILLGALSWSTYIFRTSKIANSYPELDLQFQKNGLLALMYGVWFINNAMSALAAAGTSLFSPGWTKTLTSLWAGWNSPFVWFLLIFSAIGPGTIADLLQQKGQKETSASESNIILCLESVFATLCAFLLLGEVSSMQEILGGSMIVLAAVLASR